MADVYLTRFQFTASGLSKVTSQFTSVANGLKAKAGAAGAAIGKALTGPIAAAFATMAAGMSLVGTVKEFADFEKASSAAVSRLGLNVSRTAESIRADLAKGLDVTIDESKYVKALDNVQNIQRELGATTAWTAKEVGQGIENVAAMGGDVLNMTAEGFKPFLDLASATDYALADTSASLMATLRQFELYDEQLTNSTRVADVFSKAIGMSSLDMSKLSTAMGYIGPIANSFGVGLEETTAYLAMLANAGYDGSMSGTALRGAFVRLGKPTDKAMESLEKYGITANDINPQMHSLSTILGTLKDKLNLSGSALEENIQLVEEMTRAGADEEEIYDAIIAKGGDIAAFMELFGMRAGPAMLAMLAQLDDFPSFLDNLENAAGTASTMAFQRLDNLAGALTILRSAISDLAIELGSYLAPSLRKLAEWLTSTGIPAIKSFFQALHEGDYNAVIEKLGQFITFAGEKLIGFFRYVVEGIANIIKSIDWAGLFIGLVTFFSELPGKVATELSNLITYIRDNLSTIDLSATVQNIAEAFRIAGQNAVQNLLKQFELLRNIGGLYVDLAKNFYSAFMNLNFATLGKEIAYKLGQSMLKAARNIKNIGKAISDAILNIDWRSLGRNFGNRLSKALTTGRGDLSGKFKEIFQDLPNAIRELDWQDAFQRAWDDVLEGVTSVTNAIKEAFSEMLKGIIGDAKFEEIASEFEGVRDRIKNIIDSIKDAFDGVWDSIKDKATSTFDSVKEAFGSTFEEMQRTADTVREVLGRLFDENKEKADGFIITIGQIIAKFVEWGGSAVIGALGLALEGLALILEGVFWVVNNLLIPVFSKLFTWLEPAIMFIIDKFKWFYEAIKNVIKIAVDMHNEYGSIFNGIQFLIASWANNAYDILKSWVTSVLALIIYWGSQFSTIIQNYAGSALGHITNFAREASSAIRSVIDALAGVPDKKTVTIETQNVQTYTSSSGGGGGSVDKSSWTQADFAREAEGIKGSFGYTTQSVGFGTQDTLAQTHKLSLERANSDERYQKLNIDGQVQTNQKLDGTVKYLKGLPGGIVDTLKAGGGVYYDDEGEAYIMGPAQDWTGVDVRDREEKEFTVNVETGKRTYDPELASYATEDWSLTRAATEGTYKTLDKIDEKLDGWEATSEDWKAATGLTRGESEFLAESIVNRVLPDKLFELDPESKTILQKTESGTKEIISLDKEKIEIGELTAWELEKLRKEVTNLESLPDLTEEQKGKVEDVKQAVDDAADKLASEGKDQAEQTEKAPEGTYPQRLHSSSLGYIQQIEALQAQGLAHVKSIAHKEMLKEQWREALSVAESQGITVDAKVAQIVGYEGLPPIEVDAEVKDIEVDKKTETVDLDAELSVDEESKFAVIEEIQAVEPEIESSTYLNNESLQDVVKTVEAVRPQVGVDFYIRTPITWPSSVNIGVNYYPLNSPSPNSETSQPLQEYARGGYTGRYSGPAWVDPEEVILNKAQQLGLINSLAGNNSGGDSPQIHYHFENTIISGFKDIDDFIDYTTEKTIKEYNRRKGRV